MHTYRYWYFNLFSNASAKNTGGISPPSLFFVSPNIATSLDKSENKVQIDHMHTKCFIRWKYCENRSSISWDIRLNTTVFWAYRTRHSQMSPVNSGVTGPTVTIFLHDIEASFTLLMRTLWYRYPIPFWNARATNEWSLPFFHIIGCIPWDIGKEFPLYHLHSKCFHSVKRLRKSVQRILR